MSVLRSKRTISRFEFEHTFGELYKFTAQKTSSVANRRKRWLCWKLDSQMNSLFRTIMEVNEGYFERETKQEAKEELLKVAIQDLIRLEKPLMIIWNVEKYEMRRMVAWKTLVDNSVVFINRMLREPLAIDKLHILDWRAIMSVKFMSNISELHRLIHGKIAKAPNKYDDTYSSLVIDLIDEAFYSLVKANQKIPQTAKEYTKRRDYISRAIGCLRELQRPLIFYFNIMNYSEQALRNISEKISEELKLLYAINKSDKTRFGRLE